MKTSRVVPFLLALALLARPAAASVVYKDSWSYPGRDVYNWTFEGGPWQTDGDDLLIFSTYNVTNAKATLKHIINLEGATSDAAITFFLYVRASTFGVEISVEGGPWMGVWSSNQVQYGTVGLGAYVGRSIRVRFNYTGYNTGAAGTHTVRLTDFVINNGQKAIELGVLNAGETVKAPSTTELRWTAPMPPAGLASLDLAYSVDFGTSWLPIASGLAPSATSASWMVPLMDTQVARVRLRALDTAGKVLAADYNDFTVTLDSMAPAPIMLDLPADQACVRARPYFSWTGAQGASSYEVAVTPAQGTPTSHTSGYALMWPDPLPESGNPYSWKVTARDMAGNAVTSGSRTFTIDGSPPGSFELVGPPQDSWQRPGDVVLQWTPAENRGCGTQEYRPTMNGTPCLTVIKAGEPTRVKLAPGSGCGVGEGLHTWTVTATDSAGNETKSSPRTFKIDKTGPSAVQLVNPTAGTLVSPLPTIRWMPAVDAGVGGVSYSVYLDDRRLAEGQTALSLRVTSPLASGIHRLRVRSVDLLGNYTDQDITFRVDTNLPGELRLMAPEAGLCSESATPMLCWEAASAVARYQLWVDGQLSVDMVPGTASCAVPAQPLVPGTHTFHVVAYDAAGKSRTSERGALYIDAAAPAAPVPMAPAAGASVDGVLPVFSWSAASDDVGIARYELLVDGAVVARGEGITLMLRPDRELAGGDRRWSVAAIDRCGHRTVSAEQTFHLRACAPGQVGSCGSGAGECRPGLRTCNPDATWGACREAIDPAPEVCGDGKDNDCDGKSDQDDDGCQPAPDGGSPPSPGDAGAGSPDAGVPADARDAGATPVLTDATAPAPDGGAAPVAPGPDGGAIAPDGASPMAGGDDEPGVGPPAKKRSGGCQLGSSGAPAGLGTLAPVALLLGLRALSRRRSRVDRRSRTGLTRWA